MAVEKKLRFEGSSYRALLAFPPGARREAGYELGQVQLGQEPTDWKPMSSIGIGVGEIRIKDEGGAYRVIYVAKFAEAVYVLHCFEKKTQKTSRTDLDVAGTRYRALVRARGR